MRQVEDGCPFHGHIGRRQRQNMQDRQLIRIIANLVLLQRTLESELLEQFGLDHVDDLHRLNVVVGNDHLPGADRIGGLSGEQDKHIADQKSVERNLFIERCHHDAATCHLGRPTTEEFSPAGRIHGVTPITREKWKLQRPDARNALDWRLFDDNRLSAVLI